MFAKCHYPDKIWPVCRSYRDPLINVLQKNWLVSIWREGWPNFVKVTTFRMKTNNTDWLHNKDLNRILVREGLFSLHAWGLLWQRFLFESSVSPVFLNLFQFFGHQICRIISLGFLTSKPLTKKYFSDHSVLVWKNLYDF